MMRMFMMDAGLRKCRGLIHLMTPCLCIPMEDEDSQWIHNSVNMN